MEKSASDSAPAIGSETDKNNFSGLQPKGKAIEVTKKRTDPDEKKRTSKDYG